MQSENNIKTEVFSDNRRKRINRIKRFIIFLAVLLILLPTVGCIILGFRVNSLQKQLNELNKEFGLNKQATSETDGTYAYAAVKEDIITLPLTLPNSGSEYNTAGSQTDENNTPDTENLDKKATDKKAEDKTASDNKDDDENSGIYEGKQVYLTFDDGPSTYTSEILDTLDKYKVKATFFVIGKTDEKSKELYKRIVDEGHTLGMHSYSHDYQIIYNSAEDFDKDFTKLWKLLYDTTGYKPTIYRFPGGSDNQVSNGNMEDFIRILNKKSIVYFDWNVENKDATNIKYTKKQLVDNILKGVAEKQRAIVLMHDSNTKKSTADSLPKLIEALLHGGAQILPLDNSVEPIQMIKADQVK